MTRLDSTRTSCQPQLRSLYHLATTPCLFLSQCVPCSMSFWTLSLFLDSLCVPYFILGSVLGSLTLNLNEFTVFLVILGSECVPCWLCSLRSWDLNVFHVNCFRWVPCVPGLLICSMFYVHYIHCVHCVPCSMYSLCPVFDMFTVFHVNCVPGLWWVPVLRMFHDGVQWEETERSLSCHQRELARNYQTTHNIGLRLFRIYKLNSILVRAERGWIIIGSWVSSQVSC